MENILPHWSKTDGLINGISAQFLQNVIANHLVRDPSYIDPFTTIKELSELRALVKKGLSWTNLSNG